MNEDAEKKRQLIEVLLHMKATRDRLDGLIRAMEHAVHEPQTLYHRDPRQLDLFDLNLRDEA